MTVHDSGEHHTYCKHMTFQVTLPVSESNPHEKAINPKVHWNEKNKIIKKKKKKKNHNVVVLIFRLWTANVSETPNRKTFEFPNVWCPRYLIAVSPVRIQSNFDGSNPFGTMKICSRQRLFEPRKVNISATPGGIMEIIVGYLFGVIYFKCMSCVHIRITP